MTVLMREYTAVEVARVCAVIAAVTCGLRAYQFAEVVAGESRGSSDVSDARQVAMYLMHVVFEASQSRTAAAFGRNRATVSYACGRVEDRRDDPAFDSALDEAECAARHLAEARRGLTGAPK